MDTETPVDIDDIDVLPILPSLNFQETRNFYVDTLGFDEREAPADDYRFFRRGRMELGFWYCSDPFMATNSSVLFRADAIESLYNEYRSRGAAGNMQSEDKFYVRDPHGNVLMFVRRNGEGDCREV